MKPDNITTVLFDLGGVIFELGGASTVCEWSQDNLTPELLLEKWLISPAVRSFESGHTRYPEFRKGIKKELGLLVSDEDYDQVFKGWIKGLYPEAKQLLAELSQKYEVACFSNTNEVHWEILTGQYNLFSLFKKRFASFEMGLIKPDREAFEYVIEQLPAPAKSIVFLDDSPVNVAAALDCGLQAVCVKGISEARQELEKLGLG